MFRIILATASLAAATAAVPAHARDGELHTFHCLLGCPLGAPATDDVVVREIYTLASNRITKMADWVAYRVTPDSIGASPDRVWSADPWLESDETLKPSDYDGASTALHIDRGHQAPLASFAGTPFGTETNMLSNITPQSSAVNEGPWVKVENAERDLAKKANIAVYVYTGPLFERMMRPLPKAPALHRVPSGYWKVIATQDGRATAFIMDQSQPRNADQCAMRVSLVEVELRSRLELFPMGDPSKFKPLDADLGCTSPSPPAVPPAEIPAG